MPIVSVIIPTYNTRQQLLDMVECMRAQTLQNWELIIVDDKSMDGSLEYIKSVITDERIKTTKDLPKPRLWPRSSRKRRAANPVSWWLNWVRTVTTAAPR